MKNDIKNNRGNKKGILFIILFRISHFFASGNLLLKVVGFPYRIFYMFFVQWVLGIDIPDRVILGPGVSIWHGQALIVHPDCIIGKNVTLRHSTTIGQKNEWEAPPILGDNINVGAHCIIIGNIRIGDNCIIGAGTFVNKNIPNNSIVYGVPLVIKQRT